MLFQSFTFSNGKTAKNRFFKSAMEEQLAKQNQPTMPLERLNQRCGTHRRTQFADFATMGEGWHAKRYFADYAD